jgi:hypothetical protein
VVTGPELLDSIRSGFSSLLFAKFLFRVTDTRERARGTGESCLHPPELALRLERSGRGEKKLGSSAVARV